MQRRSVLLSRVDARRGDWSAGRQAMMRRLHSHAREAGHRAELESFIFVLFCDDTEDKWKRIHVSYTKFQTKFKIHTKFPLQTTTFG